MPDVTVTIDSSLWFEDPEQEGRRPHRLVARLIARLDTATTHINPAFSRARAMGRRVDPASERIKLLTRAGGRCAVPRGCLGELRQVAREVGVSLVWEPAVRSNGTGPRSVADIERDVEARTGRPFRFRAEYQPEIIQTVLEKRQGMVVLPCGGGKTMSGIGAALASGEATLILVHTEDLLEQWVGAIRFLSGVSPRVIGGGTHDYRPLQPGEVAVAMVQTIQPNLDDYQGVLDSVGFLLVDECHRAPADLFAQVINRCQGRYRIGLSATPNRADGYGFLISALIGPTLYRLPRGAVDLIEWGYLRRPLVVPVSSGWSPSDRSAEWHVTCPDCSADPRRAKRATQVLGAEADKAAFLAGRLSCKRAGRRSVRCSRTFTGQEPVHVGKLILSQVLTEAALDPGRVDLIASVVSDGVECGRLALTLTNRKDGVRALVVRQKELGVAVRGATSETDARGAVISSFRAGRHRSLVATQLADEGLDVPALDLVVMASAGRHDGTAQQRLGRICRPDGAEVPLYLDIVDDYPAALSQWRSRASAYVGAYGPECLPTDRPVHPGVVRRLLALAAGGASAEALAEAVRG